VTVTVTESQPRYVGWAFEPAEHYAKAVFQVRRGMIMEAGDLSVSVTCRVT
jgi:hypothetical protein